MSLNVLPIPPRQPSARQVFEIDSPLSLQAFVKEGGGEPGARTEVFQGLDLRSVDAELAGMALSSSVFLGCTLGPQASARATADGALVFPELERFPFTPYRNRLYKPMELFEGYRFGDFESYRETLDGRVYQHYLETGAARPSSVVETLARRLHDHAMSDALDEFIEGHRVVAVMGGHALYRSEPGYLEVAKLSRRLTQSGFLMASGGGPGAMEATHLGAAFAGRSEEELARATEVLAVAPSYKEGAAWLESSLKVFEELTSAGPPPGRSLGIPTWTYGHEPPSVFATDIAKYFANSVREEGLLAIATSGVVFSPGSAGTLQEVFQDATQNHYETLGGPSPMIFLGRKFWTEDLPALSLLRKLAGERAYASWLYVTDSIDEVELELNRFAVQKRV